MLDKISQFFRNVIGKLPIPNAPSKRTATGMVIVVSGSIITPTRIFPLNGLATVTNIIETKNYALLIVFGIIAALLAIAFGVQIFKTSTAYIVPFIVMLIIVYLIYQKYVKPPKTGLRLEASSGTSESILSEDRDFIISLRQRILEGTAQKNNKVTLFQLDNRKITVKGDAAFDKAQIKKTIADNFKA